MPTNTLYWAADTLERCVEACEERRHQYYDYLQQNGFLFLWGLVYDFYYSATNRTALAYTTGDQEELMVTKVNDFRNLIQTACGIIVNQRPAWEVIAQNSDYNSLASTAVGKAVLEYFQKVKGLDHKLYKTVVATKKFGEGFIVTTWDQFQGRTVSKLPNGKDENGDPRFVVIKEGDLDVRVFEPIDVIRDTTITDQDQNHWYITRERRNKYDLAMKYPDQYDLIVGEQLTLEPNEHYVTFDRSQRPEDLVYVYTLYHRKTAALPQGRIVQYLTPTVVLQDSPMNYPDYPVDRMVDSPIPGTNFSYTDAFDMLQISDSIDGLVSAVLSNQRAFAVQNIIMPLGANIPLQSLSGGLNVITFDPANGGKPEALQLCRTPPEVFNMIDFLGTKLQLISGVNGTNRGLPPNQVGSGVALSFLASMATQYQQGAQESYVNVLSSVGTKVISTLAQNAKADLIAEIVGSAKSSMVSTFKGDDLKSISRVQAQPGNPLMQTIQGRFAVAQEITKTGMTAEGSNQLLTVLNTGSLDALTEGRFQVNVQIKEENQQLREGKEVLVLAYDDHLAHINEHQAITADVNIRAAEANTQAALVLKNTTDHIMEHVRFLKDPAYADLLLVLGQRSLAVPPPGPTGSPDLSGTVNVNATAPGRAALVAGAPPGPTPTPATPEPPTPTGQFSPGLVKSLQ